jgi:3-oxoadipate enol-lactonase
MTSERETLVLQPAHQQTQQETEQVQDAAGLHFLEDGQGLPVLFIHGIGGGARQFAAQLRHLRGRARAIALDLPGYGGSAPLPLVSIESLAAALGGFIAALGLERPILVGHSIGGMIVQRLIAQSPALARGVVLSQTSAAFGSKDPAWGERFVRERLGPLDAGHSMADLAEGMVAAMVGPDPDPLGVRIARETIARTPETTYRDMVLAMPGFDLRCALPRIAVPALLVAGSADPNAPAEGMRRMAARIPGAEFALIEGAGHLVHLERPAAFNALLDGFLDRVG